MHVDDGVIIELTCNLNTLLADCFRRVARFYNFRLISYFRYDNHQISREDNNKQSKITGIGMVKHQSVISFGELGGLSVVKHGADCYV